MKTPNRAVLSPGNLATATLSSAPPGELTVSFPDNRHASALFGQYDQNLARIERSLGVVCHAIGNQVTIKGPPDACERTRHVLQLLYDRIKLGQPIAMGDIDGAVQEGLLQGVLFPAVEDGAQGKPNFEQIATRKRGPVRARNAAQNVYLRALKKHELVFAEGPARHRQDLARRRLRRLAAGARRGRAPDPVAPRGRGRRATRLFARRHARQGRPLPAADLRCLERFHGPAPRRTRHADRHDRGRAPRLHARADAVERVRPCLDEAQNAASMQMKMFLTRLGEGSRMIVTGDPTQIDLPHGQRSGLSEAISLLSGLEGIGHVIFKEGDVVRHDLVRRIVGAYEGAARRKRPRDRRRRLFDGSRETGLTMNLTIDIAIEHEAWSALGDLDARAEQAVAAALAGRQKRPASPPLCAPRPELSVVLCDDAFIRDLNQRWRGKDKATNVLLLPRRRFRDAGRHRRRLRDLRARGGGGGEVARGSSHAHAGPRRLASRRPRPRGRRGGGGQWSGSRRRRWPGSASPRPIGLHERRPRHTRMRRSNDERSRVRPRRTPTRSRRVRPTLPGCSSVFAPPSGSPPPRSATTSRTRSRTRRRRPISRRKSA